MRINRVVAGLALAALGTGIAAMSAPGATAAPGRDPQGRAVRVAEAHPAQSHFGAGQAFRPTATVTDPDGTAHVHLTRTYRGLDVVGGDLIVQLTGDGRDAGIVQTLGTGLHLSVRPRIDRAAAVVRALTVSAGRVLAQRTGAVRLVVDATGSPRLAWQVQVSGRRPDGTPSLQDRFVDARTGAVRWSQEQVMTADGSGDSLYGGTVPLSLTATGGGYQLVDPTRGGTATYDMGNRTDGLFCTLLGRGCSLGKLFVSADPFFGDGTAASRESAAVDAQYGMAATWTFYQRLFGRLGVAGDGAGVPARVHYGRNYANAYWDGTSYTAGDGDGTTLGPLVSLDVVGHELTHAVTEHTAGLLYSGESGGLNEATSDILGSMIEFFAGNPAEPGDYLIGEELDLTGGDGLRRMDDPAQDGNSASCWTSRTGRLDVHYSSGVGNHFFYLLAEGSGAKQINGVSYDSPTCDGSTVAGIGRLAATRIWYRALTTEMTSNTDYAGARTATLAAAGDLYGAGSTQAAAVAAAWSAVGVG